MKIKFILAMILVLIVLLSTGCKVIQPDVAGDDMAVSNKPDIAVSPTPAATPFASLGLADMSSFMELEDFLRSVRTDKDLDIYGNINTEYYFRPEKLMDEAYLHQIRLDVGALGVFYRFSKEEDQYWENTIVFAWYRETTDSWEFMHNIALTPVPCEELEDEDGNKYLYFKGQAPMDSEWKEWREINQYLYWTQGDECFSCSFPLRYTKEEVLAMCKAVKVTVD